MYKTNPFNPMLSKHFDLFTLCASETAEEKGIHNIPEDPKIRQNLAELCKNILDPLVDHFDLPLFITSGYRCTELNKTVGGIEKSQHIIGQAADIMLGGLRNDELALWIMENLPYDELILEKFDPKRGEYGWVHVSYAARQNRKKVSTFDGETYHEGIHYFDLSARAEKSSARQEMRPLGHGIGKALDAVTKRLSRQMLNQS